MRKSDTTLPLGTQIRLRRKELGLGIKMVEAQSGGVLNRASLSRIENGLGNPSVQTLMGLGKVLRCKFFVYESGIALVPLDT